MILFYTCQCIQFRLRLVRLVALPGQSSTGQLIDVSVHGKATRNSFCMGIGNGGGKVMARPDRPCCVWRWTPMDSTTNSEPHSSHTTLRRCLMLWGSPSPVILRPKADANFRPEMGPGWHAIAADFSMLVCSLTRSKSLISATVYPNNLNMFHFICRYVRLNCGLIMNSSLTATC